MSSESDDEEFYDAKENVSLTQSPAQRAPQTVDRAQKPEAPQLSKKQEEQNEIARQEEDRKAEEEEERKRKEEEERKKKEQEELEKQLEENERRRRRLLAMRRQMEEEEEHAGDSPQQDETGSEETPVDTNPVQTSEEPPTATVDPEKPDPDDKDTSEECVPSPTPSPTPSPIPEAGDGFKTTKDISEMQADSEVETILEQRVDKEKENVQEILESPEDEPKPMTVEPDIVASTKPDIVAVSKERPGSLKVPPPRPPPPVAPPRRQKKKSANETPENEAQETPTESSIVKGGKEEPKGLLTPTSEAIESLTKELERSLDMKGATSGSTLVKVQHDDESTKAEPTPPTSPADNKTEPTFKPAEDPTAGEKENPALPRLRSASGRPLTDEEILEQVMIKNLDTGELVPLSQAEDKLPKCMNPLSLHIIRRTKEYVSNNSLNKDDSDTESVEGQSDRGKTMHQAEEKLKKGTKQLKKLFGKAVEKSVSKIKEIKDEVFAGEDSSSSDDETDTRTIKIKSSSSNKGPYEFDQLRLVQDLSGEHTGAVWTMKFSCCGRLLATAGQDNILRVWVLKNAHVYFDEMRHKYAMEARASPSPSQESVNSQNSQNSEPGSTTESPAHSQTGSGTPSEEPVEHEGPFRQIPFCSYRGHTADVLDLSWSKNYFILSSSMDKTVRLWHISRRECLCCFQHIDFVTAIAFHPRDDRYFLSGSLDGKLRLWNIPDKKVALWNELDGDIKLITAANFCENGRFAVVGTYDGRCIFFDTEHLKYFTQIHVRSTRGKNSKGRKITGIEQLPGEHKILVTSNDSRVRLYDLRDLSLSCKYKGGTNTSSQIKASLSYNGKFIVCGSEDHYIYIWKTYYDYSKFTSVRRDRNDFWEAFRAHTAVVTAAIFASNPTAIFSSMESQSPASQEKEGASKPEPGEVLVSADFSGAVKVFVNRAAKAKQQRVSEVQAPPPSAVAQPSEAKLTEQDTTAKENASAVQTSKAPPKPPRASVKGPPPSRPPPPVRPPPPAVQKASS